MSQNGIRTFIEWNTKKIRTSPLSRLAKESQEAVFGYPEPLSKPVFHPLPNTHGTSNHDPDCSTWNNFIAKWLAEAAPRMFHVEHSAGPAVRETTRKCCEVHKKCNAPRGTIWGEREGHGKLCWKCFVFLYLQLNVIRVFCACLQRMVIFAS